MITARRSFLLGATAFLAAPSIVRAASLMPVSALWEAPAMPEGWTYIPYGHYGRSILAENQAALNECLEAMHQMMAIPDPALIRMPNHNTKRNGSVTERVA